MPINLEPVITAFLASLGYAALFYVKNVLPSLAGKPFEEVLSNMVSSFVWTRFVSTLIVGVGVGVLVSIKGGTLTQETWELQFSLYAVYVITVENVLKTLIRSIRMYRTKQ